MDVRRASQLVAEGADYQRLAMRVRAGGLYRVRHGAYSISLPLDAIERHQGLVDGTWPLFGGGSVLSHASAGIGYGLPVPEADLLRVQLTRPTGGHGRVGPCVHVHYAPLCELEIVEINGRPVTSLERTAADLARCAFYDRSVSVLDAALHLGANAEEIRRVLGSQRRWHGVPVARRALAFADGRAESVGESISRVQIVGYGLPMPELQYAVFSPAGRWLARCDFAWPTFGVIGEFDGRIKYLGPAEAVADVVMAEKAREQAIHDAGWTVVRWGWQDLQGQGDFVARLRRALIAGGLH
jgi:hypothetical protein